MDALSFNLSNVGATESFALGCADAYRATAATAKAAVCVGLSGGLGAGKSCLARALLRHLGVTGPIPSPTYALLEEYVVGGATFVHMDWYRLRDPLELEMLDWAQLRIEAQLILVEWPERLPEFRSAFDLLLRLEESGTGRRIFAQPQSPVGSNLLAIIEAQHEE